MCKSCRGTKILPVNSGFAGVTLPRSCDSSADDVGQQKCPIDPYIIVHDKSNFVDQQTLKLQETPGSVPVGELPRHMLLSADRWEIIIFPFSGTVLTIEDTLRTKSSLEAASRSLVSCPFSVRVVAITRYQSRGIVTVKTTILTYLCSAKRGLLPFKHLTSVSSVLKSMPTEMTAVSEHSPNRKRWSSLKCLVAKTFTTSSRPVLLLKFMVTLISKKPFLVSSLAGPKRFCPMA